MVESIQAEPDTPPISHHHPPALPARRGTVTSDELVRRSLDAIEASQPTLNAFRVVLTEQALADAAEADRKRAAGEQLPLLGHPDRGQGRRRRRGRADPVRRRRTHPDGPPGRRGGAPAARRGRGHRRQDQHLRVGSMAIHQRPGVRPHPQPVVARTHAGRVVGRQRRRRGGRVWWPPRSARTARAASAFPRRGRTWSASNRSGAGSPPGRCPRRSTASPSTACWPARSPMRRWCSTPRRATSPVTCINRRRCGCRISSRRLRAR